MKNNKRYLKIIYKYSYLLDKAKNEKAKLHYKKIIDNAKIQLFKNTNFNFIE